jgi:F-type H+-transporting ATPase subunit d
MSGNGAKKVVDAAVKAGRTIIDWDGMAKLLVTDEARKEFAALRRAFDDVNHQLQTKFSQVSDLAFLLLPPWADLT